MVEDEHPAVSPLLGREDSWAGGERGKAGRDRGRGAGGQIGPEKGQRWKQMRLPNPILPS